MSIDEEWSLFLEKREEEDEEEEELEEEELIEKGTEEGQPHLLEDKNKDNNPFLKAPIPSPIVISTKSVIAPLNQPIKLDVFWDIPVIPYSLPQEGVIKKQITIKSYTPEELAMVQDKLKDISFYEENVRMHLDNPHGHGKLKFKDVRKISIGISRKDIMNSGSKKKHAFNNCLVMVHRIFLDGMFREFNVKAFNTGEIEIPGVQSDHMFQTILERVIALFQPFYETPLKPLGHTNTVLINSNFNCGFYLHRETLFDILKKKYHLQAMFDPCAYQGIKCKFFYEPTLEIQHGINHEIRGKDTTTTTTLKKNIITVSIFRTGSVLIIGKFEEHVLQEIYSFFTSVLQTEFPHIFQRFITEDEMVTRAKNKERKKRGGRKKTITNFWLTEGERKVVQKHY